MLNVETTNVECLIVECLNNQFAVSAYVTANNEKKQLLKIIFKDVNRVSLKPIVDFMYTGSL